MKLIDIYNRLRHDIDYIEQELEASIQSDHAFLSQTSMHLLKAGGKRIRPVIVLLAGQFGDYRLDRLKNVAVSLELLHMASLVHDDVIDNAHTRRGQLTVKSKWDNRIAMYTGDYIFAKALTIVTQLKNPLIHQILSKSVLQMCIGEMEQIRLFFDTEQSIRDYLLRIRRKTALLIAVSCQLGAIAAGTPAKVSSALYSYGYNVGMAFQIRDDILDICGTEKQLGKPPGSDVKQGNITLPFLYALQEPELAESIRTQVVMIKQSGGQADARPLLELIRRSNGLRTAEQLAARYIDKAIDALKPLVDIKAKKNLIDVAHFVGNRSY